jgi:acyl-CoA synthetase (NDP forming)
LSEVVKGAFERAGIVVIENSDELFPAVETLSSLPPLKNGKIAILADGGGHATIAADTLTDLGVGLPLLQNKTQSRLKEILPATASVVNPVDVAGGADAYETILETTRKKHPRADIRGVLVAPMAPQGLEVIIGTKIDDQFGPVIMFGLGGIFVEVLKDVVFWVLPISPAAARRMVGETKAARLLDGYRGQPAVDQKSLQRLLCQCAEVMEAYPTIREMDLNPVIVTSQGLHIVDARVILQTAPTSTE